MWGRRSDEEPRRPRYFLRGLIFIGVLVAAVWGTAFYLSPQDELRRADAVVVVSGGQTTARADEGIRLYKEGYAPKLIFSGAALDAGPSNAHQMKEQAQRAGVPDSAIETDETARTTYQNATRTKPIIDQLGAQSILLVTSPYHQRRTLLTFRHVYSDSYQLINHSSFDSRWSKFSWWASPFGIFITGSEAVKIGSIYVTKQYE